MRTGRGAGPGRGSRSPGRRDAGENPDPGRPAFADRRHRRARDRRLGLQPRRTIRFALWNGEEQGLYGFWGYVRRHRDALDSHEVATSTDIGTGRINGFFTGGMPGLVPLVDGYLGPFQQVALPLVGTDSFDFMLEGVPNLIAMQADANYASNYHAASGATPGTRVFGVGAP